MTRSTWRDTQIEGPKQVLEAIEAIGRDPSQRGAIQRPNHSQASHARRSEPKTYWLQCFKAVKACRRKDMRGPRKAVLLIIASCMNKDSHTAWPSYELIAVESGLGRTAVANALTWLREKKILTVEKIRAGRRTSRGVNASEVNIYTIDLEQLSRGPMRQDACTRALDINAEGAKLATVRHTNRGAPKRSE